MIGTCLGIIRMVGRSMSQHRLSTAVTSLSVALASGLVMAVFAISQQSQDAFTSGHGGFDAVLGARGSQTQLVLNAVFHLETSPGNIPWSLYTQLRDDPRISHAIPYALGDNYHGYRIVGTNPELFDIEFRSGQKPEIYPGGRIYDERRMEAVVGSFAARKTGLGVGSTFQPYHGLVFDERAQHDEMYTVVGVMRPTNSPMDRVIWIPIEGVFRMEGHVLRGAGEEYTPQAGQAIPDDHKEVSAVMLKLRNQQAGMALHQTVNLQGRVATLAWPIGRIMADLFDRIGWVSRILAFVAYLAAAVAAASILASIYNSINERRRDIAILRSLGARRRVIFSAVVVESAAISALGALMGFIVYSIILIAAAWIVREQTGVVLETLRFHPAMLWTPIGMTLLGAFAGILPAIKAYSTDVASNLNPVS